MLDVSGPARLWVTAGILLGASLLMHTVSHGEPVVPRQPLHELPYTISNWTGQERPLQDQEVQAVGVSDYTNRIYFERTDAPVGLYIGYYASQRTGDTIHCPEELSTRIRMGPHRVWVRYNCDAGGRNIVVNEYVVQKDQDKQLVFYWYQSRGRVIAGEYAGKFWMIADAISRNRTDGSLVPVITPMNDGEANARSRLVGFTQIVFPQIDAMLPK
jgi:EpsI family protein